MKTVLTVLGYVIAIILAIFLFRQCENVDRLAENVDNKERALTTLKLKNDQLATEKQAYVASEREMRRQMWVKDDSLKTLLKIYRNPQVVYRIKTVTEFDTIKVPFEVPVETPFSRTFDKQSDYYTITGEVNERGLNFDRIQIPNTQRIVTGVKRGWFNNEITTSVTNSNPYIQTTEMDTQTIKVKKRRLGIGFFFGYDLFGQNVSAGPSVNYNLIEF